jgi:hypothetical protein
VYDSHEAHRPGSDKNMKVLLLYLEQDRAGGRQAGEARCLGSLSEIRDVRVRGDMRLWRPICGSKGCGGYKIGALQQS